MTVAEKPNLAPAIINPVRFVDECCSIQPAEGGAPIPFRLWDFQQEVLRVFRRHPRTVVLKARQLGLSWLADAFALWMALFNRNQTVLMLSIGQREAEEELRRIVFMHRRLPADLRQELSVKRHDHIEFARSRSRIVSLPASEEAGTGYTATLLVLQELAKIEHAQELMASVMPTLAADGRLIVVSTARGYSGPFFDMWTRASRYLGKAVPTDELAPVFLPWTVHPNRSEGWREREQRRTNLSDRQVRQEYPASAAEAFQAASGTVFGEDFDRSRHLLPIGWRREEQWPVWRGVDFGLNVSPCYWIMVEAERNAYVFDELYAEGLTVGEFAEEIIARDQGLGLTTSEVRAGVDPAGMGRNMQTGLPDVEVFRQAGIPVALDASGTLRTIRPADRVDLIMSLLRQNRLQISLERCPRLVEALERAEWDRVGRDGPPRDTYKKDGKWDHALDATGYSLWMIFSRQARGQAVAVQRPATVPVGSGRFSSSEFG